MKDPADPANSRASSVPAALLDYFEAPGKYQLTLRQPALLFSSVREILQLASGRGAADAPQSSRLRDAAHFFIRAALLYPGADHYAALGLAPGEAGADLKERYRLLMRLIHPDFAQDGAATWPADAAVRVNRAYEVLSSPVLRREYDEQLAAPRTQRPAGPARGPGFHAPPPRRLEETPARFGKKAALVFGLALGVPAVLLLLPRSEPDHLVQRSVPAAGKQRAAQGEAELADQRAPALVGSGRLSPAAPAPAAPSPARPAEPPLAAARVPAPAPGAVVSHAAAAARPAPVAAPPVLAARPPVAPAAVTVARSGPALAPAPRIAEVQSRKPPEQPALPMPMPVPTNAPAPAVLASVSTVVAPVAPTPVATAVPSSAPTGKLAATLAVLPVVVPTLADAQPLLSQMLQMLETGSGEQLLRLLDGDARRQPGAQALSRHYEQLVHGSRPVRLSQVEFNGEPRDGVLLVTGHIRLHAGEPTIGSYGQRLVLRAEFAQRGGKVQLTGLSGAPD